MELRQYDDDVTDLNADQQNKETKKKKKNGFARFAPAFLVYVQITAVVVQSAAA